jgi:hypothetical protein
MGKTIMDFNDFGIILFVKTATLMGIVLLIRKSINSPLHYSLLLGQNAAPEGLWGVN